MIEPYTAAIDACTQRLAAMGYKKTFDANYGVSFSNGKYTVKLSTERYYHPSISMSLVDNKGRKFELGLVQRILAPNQYAELLAKVKDIKLRYGLNNRATDKHTRTLGIAAYSSASIEHLCELLNSFKNEPFTENEDFLQQYAKMERERMQKMFGLDFKF